MFYDRLGGMSMKITTQIKENSSAEILVTFEWADIIKHKENVLKEIQKDYEADGFRKGNVPMNIVEQSVSPIHVFEACAEDELQAKYVDILKEAKIDAIGRPLVAILKLAENNPVEIKIETAVYPEIKLPNYKKLAKDAELVADENSFNATDEDLTNTFKELQQMRAHQNAHAEGGHDEHDHSHGEITPDMYPELNDEFAKSFGFDDLDKMREKIRENVQNEKKQKHAEKSRITMIEKIIEETKVEVPEILIQSELDQMMHRMEHDISMMGLQFEDYLKHLNKTIDDLRTEYKNDAVKRVASKLIIEEIAKAEKIKPTDVEIENEVQKLLTQYPDSDKVQTTMYVESVLTTEKVFQFLEGK